MSIKSPILTLCRSKARSFSRDIPLVYQRRGENERDVKSAAPKSESGSKVRPGIRTSDNALPDRTEGTTAMAASIKDLDHYESEATVYYFIWYIVYVVLGVGSIVLPALAAFGLNLGTDNSTKYLAGLGSLAAALFGFFKPNEYISAFDAAIAEFRSLRFEFDALSDKEKASRFGNAVRLMAFKYHGLSTSQPRDGNP
jgi:hypothetical protein